jgi:hypothetical protein
MTTIRNDARTATTNSTTNSTTNTTTKPTKTTTAPKTTATANDDVEAMPATAPKTTATTTAKHLPADELARQTKAIDAATSKGPLDEKARGALIRDLTALPAADFRAVMSDQARVQKLMSAVDGDDRATVLGVFVKKGVVGVEPSDQTPPTSPFAPVPPQVPGLLRDDTSAAPALRQAILDENLGRVAIYKEQFSEYVDAYHDAVDEAPTMSALRDLGPRAVSRLPVDMPGVATNSAENRAYRNARGLLDIPNATNERIFDRRHRLNDTDVAGTSLTGEAELALMVGPKKGPQAAIGGKVEGTVGPDLHVETGAHGLVGGFAKDDFGVTIDHNGAFVGLGVVGFGVHANEKELTLDGKLGPVTGSAGLGEDRMSFGMGVAVHPHVAGASVHAGIGAKATYQGVKSADRASFRSSSHVDFFDSPPELTSGRSWSSLPAEVRSEYAQLGWTDGEWTKKADLARFARRAR